MGRVRETSLERVDLQGPGTVNTGTTTVVNQTYQSTRTTSLSSFVEQTEVSSVYAASGPLFGNCESLGCASTPRTAVPDCSGTVDDGLGSFSLSETPGGV